ncbi:hypothetical protein Tco_0233833 [Tanacetum coccineum]
MNVAICNDQGPGHEKLRALLNSYLKEQRKHRAIKACSGTQAKMDELENILSNLVGLNELKLYFGNGLKEQGEYGFIELRDWGMGWPAAWNRQCTSSDGDSVAPCLLMRLATPDCFGALSWHSIGHLCLMTRLVWRRCLNRIRQQSFKVFFDLHLTLFMAKKDMHTYVLRLKDTELETLIATYDIPLDLRPRLPDPNFKMINMSAEDTAIGIYSRIFDSSGERIEKTKRSKNSQKPTRNERDKNKSEETAKEQSRISPTQQERKSKTQDKTLSKQGDWFSFAKRGDHAPVCMEVIKSGLKLWKEKFFLIDHRAILFYMPWRHPGLCITDKVPTDFNQNHVNQLKAHIVKLRDIPEGVLVRSGLSRVWRNPMCGLVLRRSDNTVMGIYDFLCMPSLDKATVREESHGLDTSILGRVVDRTTSPAPAGTTIPRASLEEITVTRLDHKVVTKANHVANQNASTRPEISTNTAKKIKSGKKVSGACSSGLAVRDEVEQTDDDTLDDDDDQRDGSYLGLDVTYPPILLPDKEVEAHVELFGGEAVPAPDTQPLDVDVGADEIASDGNVDLYYEARVSSRSESPPYTRYDWEEIHGVNLGLRKKELYKDPKACRTALDQFPTSGETHRLRELSSVELSDRMSQTRTIKKQIVDLRQRTESTIHANEEVSRKYRNERDVVTKEKAKIKEELVETKSQLEHRGRKAEEIHASIASFFQSDFTPLVRRFLKSSEFNWAFAGVLNTAISVGVERRLRMDRTVAAFLDTAFPFLNRVSQNYQSPLQDIARLKPDRVAPSYQTSSAAVSSRAITHLQYSTSSSGTFGRTSTPQHLKKKSVKK